MVPRIIHAIVVQMKMKVMATILLNMRITSDKDILPQ
jgi:hypothetical protein